MSNEKLADDLSAVTIPSCKHMEREEYRDCVLQMLDDLEQLGRRDGCIAAAWALDALPSLQRELAEARAEIESARTEIQELFCHPVCCSDKLDAFCYPRVACDKLLESLSAPAPSDVKGEELFVAEAECDAAWEEFKSKHIVPARLFRLALMGQSPTPPESKHIDECKSCGDAFRFYRDSQPAASTTDVPYLTDEIEQYLRDLQFNAADDKTITLVHGNIRGFAMWLREQGHLKSRASLTPLTDQSVRGVLVDDGEPRIIQPDEMYLEPDGELGEWSLTTPSRSKLQPVTLRPASEFGVAARGEPGLKKLPEGAIIFERTGEVRPPKRGEWFIAPDLNEVSRATICWADHADLHRAIVRYLDPALYAIPDGGERERLEICIQGLEASRDHALNAIAEALVWPDAKNRTIENAVSNLLQRFDLFKATHNASLKDKGERIKELEAAAANRVTELSVKLAECRAELNQATHDGQRMAVAVHALDDISDAVPGSDDTTDYMEVARLVVAKIKSDEKEMIADTDQICSLLDRASSYKAEIERLRKAIEKHKATVEVVRPANAVSSGFDLELWSALSPSPAAASGETEADSLYVEAMTDAIKRAISAPAAGQTMESAWLLETQIGGSPVWFTSNNKYRQFTTDACAADRFSSKETAEAFASKIRLSDWKATEHGFYGTSAPAAESQGNAQHHSEGAKILEGGSGSSAEESEGGEREMLEAPDPDSLWDQLMLERNSLAARLSASRARLAACEEGCRELEAGIEKHKSRMDNSGHRPQDYDRDLWSLLAPKAGGEDAVV